MDRWKFQVDSHMEAIGVLLHLTFSNILYLQKAEHSIVIYFMIWVNVTFDSMTVVS